MKPLKATFQVVQRTFVIGLFCSMPLLSCSGKSGSHSTGASSSGAGQTTTTSPAPGTEDSADSITPEDLSTTSLGTKSSAATNCVEASFIVSAGKEPLAGATVSFTVTSMDSKKDIGAVSPESMVSDAEGKATTKYCAGDDEGGVVIVAKVGKQSVNSATINVATEATYSFEYFKSDLITPAAAAALADAAVEKPEQTLAMNIFDAGPDDCTNIYFKLLKGGSPIQGQSVRFLTQTGYPKGVKLATRSATGLTVVNAVSGKKQGYADVESNADGIFRVPICTGFELGTVYITGSFTDDKKVVHEAQGPVIRIISGLVNYENMSITFDATDARTLKGYFETNSAEKHPFWMTFGSLQDGYPINRYSARIAAEFGRVDVDNSGLLDATGTVKFTVESLHDGGHRPYMVKSLANSGSISRCDPEALAAEATTIKYIDLMKNWRSTVVYAIPGQEQYHDANQNGKYDVGGDGFWDKNQNGIFDAGDVLTYDANSNGFDLSSEWFIDLPTPFVDVDENGAYDAGRDILLGDEYLPPNGVRDTQTDIWKYFYAPVYMGTSPFSMVRSQVVAGNLNAIVTTDGDAYFADLNTRGLRNESDATKTSKLFGSVALDQAIIFGAGSTTLAGYFWSHFFIHDVCGGPVPGGTPLQVSFEDIYAPTYGDRPVTAHFYTQPGDAVREPARRLLKAATGAATATVNYNIVDHPASAASYPIEFAIKVGACTADCSGSIKTTGKACDAKVVKAKVSLDLDTVGNNVSIPAARSCVCADYFNGTSTVEANFGAGSCACPSGTVYDTVSKCIVMPPDNMSAIAVSATAITVTWVDRSGGTATFIVERSLTGSGNWTQAGTPAVGVSSFPDTGLAENTTYYYRVMATNVVGTSTASDNATATTLRTVPAAPSALAATANSATSITVTWTDASANEDSFILQRSPNGATAWATIASPATNATSYIDTTVVTATQYYYRVAATNTAGTSAYSATANATTP